MCLYGFLYRSFYIVVYFQLRLFIFEKFWTNNSRRYKLFYWERREKDKS